METTAARILAYLRDEFEADPDYSRRDLQDICDMLELPEAEARKALHDLQTSGKVYCFQDCDERQPDEWRASGALIHWYDADE